MIRLPHWMYKIDKLIINPSVNKWCKLPYPGHKNGCPNYGKMKRCPPECKPVNNYFDLSKPVYFVHSEFNLDNHAAKMKDIHLDWSDRQCRCVLYWQSKSRKQLKNRIEKIRVPFCINMIATTPEAMGVNVYATARLAGLNLERIRNLSICRHIAMVGSKIDDEGLPLFYKPKEGELNA